MLATETRWFDQYLVNVPEGRSGPWRVERFTINPEDAKFTFRLAMEGRDVSPGTYTRLKRDGAFDPMMSDTPAEIRDHLEPIRRATGQVLLNGLGLGMVLKAALAKPDVERIDVVEIDADIIKLVGPSYIDPRVTIYHADAFTIKWPTGMRWNVAWHDIWPSICADNLAEMGRLHRRYARRVDWQGSWCKETCQYYARRRPLGYWY